MNCLGRILGKQIRRLQEAEGEVSKQARQGVLELWQGRPHSGTMPQRMTKSSKQLLQIGEDSCPRITFEVNIQIGEDSCTRITFEVNGKGHYQVLLDSGASDSFISQSLVSELLWDVSSFTSMAQSGWTGERNGTTPLTSSNQVCTHQAFERRGIENSSLSEG